MTENDTTEMIECEGCCEEFPEAEAESFCVERATSWSPGEWVALCPECAAKAEEGPDEPDEPDYSDYDAPSNWEP